MKVGDKVLCKKAFSISGFNIHFTEGKYYYIHRVESDYNISSFYILGDGGIECDFEFDEDNTYKFSEHFYTGKELRKLKLDKINECR